MSSYGITILQDTSTVFGSGDMESDNSEEQDPTPVAEIEDQNQGNGHIVNAMSKTVCYHADAYVLCWYYYCLHYLTQENHFTHLLFKSKNLFM